MARLPTRGVTLVPLYFRARAALSAAALCVALGAIGGVLGGDLVELPVLLGTGSGPFPVGNVVAALIAIAMSWPLQRGERPVDLLAVRRLAAWDVALLLCLTLLTAASVFLGSGLSPTVSAWFLRNTALLVGIVALAAAFRASTWAGAVAVGLFLATSVYGTSAPGARLVRVLQNPLGDTWSLLVSVAVFVTGLAAMSALRGRPLAFTERLRGN